MNDLAGVDKGADWRRLKALVLSFSSRLQKPVVRRGLGREARARADRCRCQRGSRSRSMLGLELPGLQMAPCSAP
jgi:hypothetical protein